MEHWTTPVRLMTANKGQNAFLRNDKGELVSPARIEKAFKELDATGFWVVANSRRVTAQAPVYVASFDLHYVHLMSYGGSRPFAVPRASFQTMYRLAE